MEENFVHEKPQPRIFILTGAYDDQYLETRQDYPVICTSAGKRIILYQAIEKAVGIISKRSTELLYPALLVSMYGGGLSQPTPISQ